MNARLLEALRVVAAELAPREPVAPDDVIAFPYGLEASAARKLEANGRIKPAKIGRKRYVRRSIVLALVDELGAEQAKAPKAGADATSKYLALVGQR